MLDGIDEHPIEAHRRRPGEMLAPAGKRPGEEGKKVIEGHRMRWVEPAERRAVAETQWQRHLRGRKAVRRRLSS